MTATTLKPLNFIDKLSNRLAVVFHPIFLFFYVTVFTVLAGNTSSYNDFDWKDVEVMGTALILTVIAPILVIRYYTKESLELPDQKERSLPILITALAYTICWVVFRFVLNYNDLNAYLASLVIGLFVCYLINFRFKISLHASGFGSLLPFCIVMFLILSAFGTPGARIVYDIIALLVLICFSLVLRQRYVSGAHTMAQVVAGFMLGLVGSCAILYYSLYSWFRF